MHARTHARSLARSLERTYACACMPHTRAHGRRGMARQGGFWESFTALSLTYCTQTPMPIEQLEAGNSALVPMRLYTSHFEFQRLGGPVKPHFEFSTPKGRRVFGGMQVTYVTMQPPCNILCNTTCNIPCHVLCNIPWNLLCRHNACIMHVLVTF